MIIHWIPLLCGLSFGLIPPRLLMNSECRYLRFEGVWGRLVNPTKTMQRRRRWWKLPLVWIDPFRGFFVAQQLCLAFDASPAARGIQTLFPVVSTILLLGVVVWVQTCGRREHDETLSPAGFMGGMMIAMLPPVVALSAIALGVSTAIVMKRFVAGYIIAAATTAGMGYLFQVGTIWLAGYTVVVAAPLLIAWFRRTSLVMPVRC